jgi:hypothetical protein
MRERRIRTAMTSSFRGLAPCATALAAALAITASLGAAVGAQAQSPGTLLPMGANAYGMPGMIDMPTATSMPDGTLAFTGMVMPGTWRLTGAFQASPRLTLSFRYVGARTSLVPEPVLYDRSFDLHWRVLDEGQYLPALAIGLRDFIGTGLYSSEYIVATRTINPRLRASLGIGWGRMATHGSFTNPLAALSDGFRTRPGRFTGTGGRFEVGRFFRGPAALFGGIEYQATDRLTLLAEYSSDAYVTEARRGLTVRTPFNFGFRYQLGAASAVSGYVLNGASIGVGATFALNPAQPSGGPVRVGAPAPVRLRPAPVDGGAFPTAWAAEPGAMSGEVSALVSAAMQAEGLRLDAIELEARRAVLRFANAGHEVLPRAMGRAARILSYGLPDSVEEIVLIPMNDGVAGTAVVFNRADLEALQHDPDGAAALLARTRFADPIGFPGVGRLWQPVPEGRGRLQWSLGPYINVSYFDPNRPARIDFGVDARLRYLMAENLSFNATLSRRIWGDINASPLGPPSPGYPRVRTNGMLYSTDRPTLDRLTLDYTLRPGPDLYGRLTVGMLERMYGGVSAELLWAPVDSRLALGIEVNAVAQRRPGSLLGFNNLRRTTGHVSAYYDFGGGYLGQVDVGQYLAGDRGATFRLARTFASGVSVGAWATFTDMPFSVFGEGSFDKGITVTIPFTALSGQRSTQRFGTSLNSITRDGGAMLSVPGRLYPAIQESRAQALRRSWGAVLQ